MAYYTHTVNPIGVFIEKEVGNYFEYSINDDFTNSPVIGSEPFIIFPIMAVLYFCLCYPLAIYAKYLEKKYIIEN